MKTVILCGGTGTRMKEETEFKPKPLVLVGGKPILWHIMKIYAHHGYNEFILALGYKGHMIKEFFMNWRNLVNDFTHETKSNSITFHNNDCDDFKITFDDTGEDSLTGERVRRLAKYIGEEDFMLTYGDGVADIIIGELVEFHKSQNTAATITGGQPSNRFGFLDISSDRKKVEGFRQNNVTEDGSKSKDFINGGFMIFKNEVLRLIEEGSMIESVFEPLIKKKQLSVLLHEGDWKCMDTYKEVEELNELWQKNPFWKVWKS